jgi:hypothetical protein
VGTELIQRILSLGRAASKLAPYLLIELVLPGGTLIALVLYLSRNGYLKPLVDRTARINAALERATARVDDRLVAPLQQCFDWRMSSRIPM